MAEKTRTELLFVSWAENCSRSDSIAQRLGGESHMVYSPIWGSRYWTIPFKYFVQAARTLSLLIQGRPRVVVVMAPPAVACIPVIMYCLLARAKMAIDAHTGAFLDPRWRKIEALQRFCSRRAITTIVTNDHLRRKVESWGAHATIVRDVPVCFSQPTIRTPVGRPMLTVVCSFCPDEPLDDLLTAAKQLPEVHFCFTGDHNRLPLRTLQTKPVNVTFLGFLSDADYVGQMLASDGIIALTTRDHTMQRGAYEAIYLGRPILTSDFEILRASFDRGAVHVSPTSEGIKAGVQELLRNISTYTEEAKELRQQKVEEWDLVADELAHTFDLSYSPKQVAPPPTPSYSK